MRARTSDWVVPVVRRGLALIVGFLGLVNVLAAVAPGWHRSLAHALDAVPGIVENTAVVTAASVGVLMLFLAGGLARGKRRAWLLVIVVLLGELVARVFAGVQFAEHGWRPVLVTVALLAIVLMCRPAFRAPSLPITWRRALVIVGSLMLGAVALGTVVVGVRAHALGVEVSPQARLVDAAEGLVGLPSIIDQGDTRGDDLAYDSLRGMGVGIGLVVVGLVVRSPRFRPRRQAWGERAARALVASQGREDSLAYFALRTDKSLMWGHDRRSLVAYSVVGGVMLASGDPLGPVSAWPSAMTACVTYARRHGLTLAVAGCGTLGAAVWREHAHVTAMAIGDEAVLELPDFSLEGRAMRNVRQMVHRAARNGVRVRAARVADLDAAQRWRLRELATAWRDGRAERGFSMALGRVCDERDPEVVITWAEVDAASTEPGAPEIVGLIQWVPWGADGLSVDIMRRAPHAPAGTMDLMIVDLALGRVGPRLARLSLNFAPFRALLEESADLPSPTGRSSTWWRMRRAVLRLLVRGTQAQTLRRFNAKYRPQWRPRYLLFPTMELPRAATAYLRAESLLPALPRRPAPSAAA